MCGRALEQELLCPCVTAVGAQSWALTFCRVTAALGELALQLRTLSYFCNSSLIGENVINSCSDQILKVLGYF